MELTLFVRTLILLATLSSMGLHAQQANDPTPNDLAAIPAPPLSERVYGLSVLWSEAKFSFAFFDQVPNLDWDATYQTYLARVEQANTMYDYYRELQSFVALLSDGHTGVRMPSSLKRDSVPLWLEVIDGRYFVQHSVNTLIERVPVGSEIVSVQGMATAQYVESKVAPYIGQSSPQAKLLYQGSHLLDGFFGESIAFSIKTPSGELREVVAKADYFYGPDVEAIPARPSRDLHLTWLTPEIAKVHLPSFGNNKVAEDFTQMVPELQKAKAIILDIRMNGGGMTSVATGVLRHFTDRNLDGPSWRTRRHQAAHRVWGAWGVTSSKDFGELNAWTEPMSMPTIRAAEPGALFGIPVAVLTSNYTASTAEDFLVYADTLEAFTRIGQFSMGSTGQPLPIDLPGGGAARICTKRDTWPDGTDFVGIGIKPDVYVPRTREAIINQQDPSLEVATAYLIESIKH